MRSSPLLVTATILLSLCGMSTQNGMHSPVASSSPLTTDEPHSTDPHMHYLTFDASKFGQLRNLPAGTQLRFDDFLGLGIDLDLRIYQALTSNAAVVTVAADGTQSELQRSTALHLTGVAHGDASSMVLISLSPSGTTGFIRTAGLSLSIEAAPEADRHSVLLRATGTHPHCANICSQQSLYYYLLTTLTVLISAHNTKPCLLAGDDLSNHASGVFVPFTPQTPVLHDALEPPAHIITPLVEHITKPVLTIALECDQKCKARLEAQSTGTAAEYIQTLIAGVNTIFERDIGRGIQISHLRIWDSASPFDGGTNSLVAFKDYYAQNMQGMRL